MGIPNRMREAIRKLKRVGSARYTNQAPRTTNTHSNNVLQLGRSATESDKAEQDNSKTVSHFTHIAFLADEDASKGSIALEEIGGRVTESATALNAVCDDSNEKDTVISKLREITTNHDTVGSGGLRSQHGSIGSDTFQLHSWKTPADMAK